ncbi:hypothetical protein OTU49_000496 [Cherax quadricarinatus]|uniref:GCK domain-containing protein n=2 Tax=Cherax quadricarinatus TaxID=27406 RepID=A0AAW0Y1C0_CHEQU
MFKCLCEDATEDACTELKTSLRESLVSCFTKIYDEKLASDEAEKECAEDQATPSAGPEQHVRRLLPRFLKMTECVAATPGQEVFKGCLDKLWADRPKP